MRPLAFALVVLVAVASARTFSLGREREALREAATADPEPLWFTQRLDHFSSDTRTWAQKYYVNTTFYQRGGAVFWPLNSACASGHYIMNTYAVRFNALIVCAEHRFYGSSVPLPANLKYLTSRQALEDYAAIVKYVVGKYTTGRTKVISFGGSYPGMLSAWFRMLYPNLISGAIASSAPVEAQVNFPEYLEVVTNSLATVSNCSNVVRAATAYLTQLAGTSEGRKTIESLFGLCEPLTTTLDVVTFFESVADGLAGFVQYNNDNNGAYPFNITEISAGPPVVAFPKFFQWYTTVFQKEKCMDASYASQLVAMRNTTPSASSASRCWYWQTCNEFGFYQTGDSPRQAFSSSIKLPYFTGLCTEVFGVSASTVQRNIDKTLSYYGGRNIKQSHIIFVNGEIDPWHALGVLSVSAPEQYAFVLPTTAHCADLYPPRESDAPALTATRDKIVSILKSWLH